ncbi:MAG: S41 family peptidase [Acidobacteriota bacterium]
MVRGLAAVLRSSYLDPMKGDDFAKDLERFGAESLSEPLKPGDLAVLLTEQLYALSGDLHFHVGVDAEWIAEQKSADDPAEQQKLRLQDREEGERGNFFFDQVKVLEGNIGYLSFTAFADPDLGSGTLAAAMAFLGHCDAYVVDLRNNNGGYLEMAQLLASYFLADVDQLLFDYYTVEDGRRIERRQWVLPSVPGERRPEAPLYVLTSSTTFSAAEWFAYVLGGLGRAVVVGERTAGGAHPVDRRAIDDRFVVNVPIGEIRGPVEKGDFEGVGVEPTVSASARDALHLAHLRAIDALSEAHPERQDDHRWLRPRVEARLDPYVLEPERGRALVGDYGGRTVSYEDGTLYYSWNGRSKIALIPLSSSLFALEGLDAFRFRIVEAGRTVTALERIYADGTIRRREKSVPQP